MYKYIDFWSMEHGAWSIISRHTLCALPYAN